ncbi:MAG: hemolysin family protein [Lachnospiraceae bacterium]|nr:hemolysin family protein [Lachnospiraceae bacterium]
MMSQILVLIVLILLNAFFAATEMAFITVNDNKIEKLAKEGNKKAKSIHKMLRNPSKFLATIQIGITIAGFLSSAFASDAFADKLAPALNNLYPTIGLVAWRTIAIVLITLILSYFTLVFGELVPKRLAMKYYQKIAFAAVKVIKILSIVSAPFVKLLTLSTNIISKIFGVSEHEEETVTEEEIRLMVDVGEENGSIHEQEKEFINNVFEFNDKTVSEIMTHRKDIYGVDISTNISDIIAELDEYKYSRIPVYNETVDEIKGILYIKDILKYVVSNKDAKTKDLMRDAYFVSEGKLINELFKELQKNKMQLAVVLDEYGGTSGIVTMEDMIEEIVGNIFDEYDEIEKDYEKIDDNTFLLSGQLSISDVKKLLEVEFPEGDYDTLSGYLIEKLGRIVEDGENIEIETDDVTYRIQECKDKRILWVKACKNHTQEVLDDINE